MCPKSKGCVTICCFLVIIMTDLPHGATKSSFTSNKIKNYFNSYVKYIPQKKIRQPEPPSYSSQSNANVVKGQPLEVPYKYPYIISSHTHHQDQSQNNVKTAHKTKQKQQQQQQEEHRNSYHQHKPQYQNPHQIVLPNVVNQHHQPPPSPEYTVYDCRDSIKELRHQFQQIFNQLTSISEQNQALEEELYSIWTENENLKTAMFHTQKNILALTSHVQKIHKETKELFGGQTIATTSKPTLKTTTTRKPSTNNNNNPASDGRRIERRLNTLDLEVKSFNQQIADVQDMLMSDYSNLMRRINKVEDSVAKCCDGEDGRKMDGNQNNVNGIPPFPTRRTTRPTRPPSSRPTLRTTRAPFNPGASMKDPVVFCAKEQFQTQRFLNETLQFGEVQYQMDDWFSLNSGIFTVPTSGIYLFTVSYKTRTCGALSLCAPTVVQLVKNVDAVQTFSRSLSDNANTDMDMVTATVISEGLRGDEFYLTLLNTVGEGIKDLQFCGYLLP